MGAHGSGSPPAEGGAAALARAGRDAQRVAASRAPTLGMAVLWSGGTGRKGGGAGARAMCGAGGGVARGGGRRAHELCPGVRRPAVGVGGVWGWSNR